MLVLARVRRGPGATLGEKAVAPSCCCCCRGDAGGLTTVGEPAVPAAAAAAVAADGADLGVDVLQPIWRAAFCGARTERADFFFSHFSSTRNARLRG